MSAYDDRRKLREDEKNPEAKAVKAERNAESVGFSATLFAIYSFGIILSGDLKIFKAAGTFFG